MKRAGWLLALMCAPAIAAADVHPPPARPPVGATAVIDRPVAIVNHTAIWQSELDQVIRARRGTFTPDLRRTALEGLIDTVLLLEAAKLHQFGVTPDELDAAVLQIKQQNGLDDAGFDKVLADAGFTRAAYRDEVARQLTVQKFVVMALGKRIAVTDDELQRTYAELKAANAGTGALDADLQEQLRSMLRSRKLDAERVKWLERARRSAHIERRP